MVSNVNTTVCNQEENKMFKKLGRLVIALIFGMFMLMNISHTFSSNSVLADGTELVDSGGAGANGTIFTSGGGITACLCSGTECLYCHS